MKSAEDQLHLCKELHSSLVSETSGVHIFRGKWSVITSKLCRFPSLLSDLADIRNFASEPLSSDLLNSIVSTFSHALSLLHLCQSASPSLGKLQIQSDLDAVSYLLNRHLREGELMIKSGILQEKAVIAAPPREAVRCEIRYLITRLQIGDPESKISAMDAILSLFRQDEKNALTAVNQGAVPVLVKLLDSNCVEVKEKAVWVIANVSVIDSGKHVLVAEGLLLLTQLLRILESGTASAKEKACIVLQALSFSKENAGVIGFAGGVASLLEICQEGTPSSQATAAGALRSLAGAPAIRSKMVEENGIPVLLTLSASGTHLAQENAIGCLSNLVSGDDENLKLMVVRAGGIECLKTFWDGADWASSQQAAVELLKSLASCKAIAELLISSGFISRLVVALTHRDSAVRTVAARTVFDMALNTKAKKEMGEAGCIRLLVQMFDSKAEEEKEAAAVSLSLLLSYAGNRKIFRAEERGIETAVQLLDPLQQNSAKKHLIALLISLARCKKCRRRMVASGAYQYLRMLGDMQTEGARRLSEILKPGRLWGVFAR